MTRLAYRRRRRRTPWCSANDPRSITSPSASSATITAAAVAGDDKVVARAAVDWGRHRPRAAAAPTPEDYFVATGAHAAATGEAAPRLAPPGNLTHFPQDIDALATANGRARSNIATA
jgi:hypothetical protein